MKASTKRQPPLSQHLNLASENIIKNNKENNVNSSHMSALENLDKEDLLKMVKTMMGGGMLHYPLSRFCFNCYLFS